MQTKEDQLKPGESLEIINAMIGSTKRDFSENGFIYLFWGWLVLTASLAQFFLVLINFEHNWLPWLLTPAGAVFTFVYFARKEKKQKAKSIFSNVFAALWIYISANLIIVPFIFHSVLEGALIAVILLLIGWGTVVSGAILRFKPLIFGGVICNLLAIACFVIPEFYQVPCVSLAVLFTNIIPGYILRACKETTRTI